MENKNKVYLIGAGALIAGLLIGWCMNLSHSSRQYGMMDSRYSKTETGHMMPDGTMMGGMDMDDMMANMNANLQGKAGDAFDKEFLSEMIVHHQGAIDMAKLALTNAKHQEIKDLANAIIAAQTKEIGQMSQWQKSWYTK